MPRKQKPTVVGNGGMPVKAVIYARVSSKDQAAEGFSIDAQLKLLREYALKHGFEVVAEYVDVETAKRAGRAKFGEMVTYVKRHSKSKHPADLCRVILVEKTDRLYRNFRDWVTLDVDELNLEVHLVKENEILSPDSRSSAKFIHGVRVLMAKNYCDNLSEEVRKGMLEKAQQGIYPSVAPFGYLNVRCDSKRFIQPDPERAPLIRQLFEWYGTGNYSLAEVTKMINAAGLTYRGSSHKMQKSVVHRMLINPVYYGDFYWDGQVYHGTHDPIVSRELWEHVQDVLYERGKRNTGRQVHDWPFQGLLSCGSCGCALTAEIKKGRYVYYHCTGYKGKCGEKYVREEELARQFGEALRAVQLNEKVYDLIVRALKASHHDQREFHMKAIARLQTEYTRLQQRIDAAYEDKLDAKISEEFFDRKYQEWREEQQVVLRDIQKHEHANAAYIEEGIELLLIAREAYDLYEREGMTEKRRILNVVLSNSTYSAGKVHPVYRKPFNMLVSSVDADQNVVPASVSSGHDQFWYGGESSNRCLPESAFDQPES